MTFQVNLLIVVGEIILSQEPMLETTNKVYIDEKINRHEEVVKFQSQVWMLYFDGSKSQEGPGAGCIFIDPKGN